MSADSQWTTSTVNFIPADRYSSDCTQIDSHNSPPLLTWIVVCLCAVDWICTVMYHQPKHCNIINVFISWFLCNASSCEDVSVNVSCVDVEQDVKEESVDIVTVADTHWQNWQCFSSDHCCSFLSVTVVSVAYWYVI